MCYSFIDLKAYWMAIRISRRWPFNADPLHRLNSTAAAQRQQSSTEWAKAKPFDQIPGAKKWPIIGTAWQMLPFVGHYSI